MLNISRLFGKSPFSPLQTHMEKVADCIKKLQEILHSLLKNDHESLVSLVAQLSKLEHEADLTKNTIRNQLPKSLFLAIDRSDLLEILTIQDDISDKAEEIGHLIILKPLATVELLSTELKSFFSKNIEAFFEVYQIMKEMDNLLEASFGGMEAQKVKTMIDQTAYKEYESDLLKHRLMQILFEKGKTLSAPDFFQWMKVIEEIGSISHICENLAMRIRSLLELN
jgi:predicted phosphate transport protein (TIGR00153 family)